MVIAVLFGGQSHEYPVSLMSVTSVLNNLDSKYDVYMVGITEDGRWYHYSGDVARIENNDWINDENNEEVILSANTQHRGFYQLKQHSIQKVDIVFPVLHGRNGEDGTIQGLCQLAGIPVVSCNMTTCGVAMDKVFTHIICENAGIPMAKYIYFNRDYDNDYEKMYAEAVEKLGLPCYVKPSREGSSFGAHKIKDKKDFFEYVEDAYKYDRKILVEEFIDGHEVGTGVLGRDNVGEVYEVVVETEMYGFAEKYDGYKTNIYVPAKTISKEDSDRVKELALKVYKALDCDGIARVDFFASSKGIIFNEANLIPGFTSHSLYPATYIAKGYTYTQVLNELIEYTLGK